MKRYLFLILLLIVFCWSLPAYADKLSGSGKVLYESINSGGATMQQTGYILRDAKGEVLGNKMSGSGKTFIPGILIITTSGTTEEAVGPIGPDDGIIQQTVIVRVADTAGSNVKLSWAYKQGSGVTQADIWRYGGVGVPVSLDPNDWEKVASSLAGPEWEDTVDMNINSPKVGDATNAYFRIVPAGTAQGNILLEANNARTAGKVDVDFPSGYTLLEIPVWTSDMTLATVIGGQLDNVAGGDELYDYSMNKSTYASGSWVGNPLSFEQGRGYYLRILNTQKKLTFVGLVNLDNITLGLNPGYSMVGNPYPLIKDVATVFQGVSVGDELYDKFANKKTYTGSWVGAAYDFGIGDGFWFRRMDNTVYNWQLQP